MMSISHHLPHVGERVRLKTNVPNLDLHCGEEGSVCSTWFSPISAFEVEFRHPGERYPVRAVLMENQIIEAEEQPQLVADA